jgi:hypothetical protein
MMKVIRPSETEPLYELRGDTTHKFVIFMATVVATTVPVAKYFPLLRTGFLSIDPNDILSLQVFK